MESQVLSLQVWRSTLAHGVRPVGGAVVMLHRIIYCLVRLTVKAPVVARQPDALMVNNPDTGKV